MRRIPLLAALARPVAVLAVMAVAAVAVVIAPQARAQEVVADLSEHLVAITTGFIGTDVLLFGTTEGEGDVVVVVRGPLRREVVRSKARVAGIWINDRKMEFDNVPAFYATASSKPVAQILSKRLRQRHHIGTEYLDLRPVRRNLDPKTVAAFREGLIRNKVRQGLYLAKPGPVTFLGNRLFRTRLYFPSNVPTGTYVVETLLVNQGVVQSAQTSPLLISKVGLGAAVYQFAHRNSILYGIIAIVIALAAGWTASVVFRKT